MNIRKKTALLIIDTQLGNFIGDNPIYNGKNLLKKLRLLIKHARKVNIPIVFIQNMGGKDDPDEPGTPGFEIHPFLEPDMDDIIVQKKTPDSFYNTGLEQELVIREIEDLVIGGLQTEYCVDTTCRRAFSLGYKTILVEDAHSTWNSIFFTAEEIIKHHNDVLGSWFATLKKTKDVTFLV